MPHLHNNYAVSCAGAALDEIARWEETVAAELLLRLKNKGKRTKVDTDPVSNPAYINHQAELHHYAREVELQLKRLHCESTRAALVAWGRVVRHNGRLGAEDLVVAAIQATCAVWPRARRILP